MFVYVWRERERQRERKKVRKGETETEKERTRAREREGGRGGEREREEGGRACACLIESGGREMTWGFSRDFDAESVEKSVGLDSSWQWHLPHTHTQKHEEMIPGINLGTRPSPPLLTRTRVLPPVQGYSIPGGKNDNRAGAGKTAASSQKMKIKILEDTHSQDAGMKTARVQAKKAASAQISGKNSLSPNDPKTSEITRSHAALSRNTEGGMGALAPMTTASCTVTLRWLRNAVLRKSIA